MICHKDRILSVLLDNLAGLLKHGDSLELSN
jgi:hypothetical protein